MVLKSVKISWYFAEQRALANFDENSLVCSNPVRRPGQVFIEATAMRGKKNGIKD